MSTYPNTARPPSARGRHAADEPDPAAAPPPPRWWRRLLPRTGDDVVVEDGQLVVRVRGALDDLGAAQLTEHVHGGRGLRLHQVVVVHLGGCDFVNARGFRALLLVQDQVVLHAGRLLVLDPPRTLRVLCATLPGRLTLVPDGGAGDGGAPEVPA
ncbi:hypothetical protein TEK04_14545 [Klenkia sp. LSe6-5]|uniref:STAS domain-containing protein n=1 Tax=Klenkia sesuvii TaxID=3103137 RepID=A0ABU8DY30_9ACTN